MALSLEGDLQDRGFDVIGAAPNVATALSIIERSPPDLAILDVNLGNETSMPVADALHARGIPFVFATGYGAGLGLPAHLATVPVVSKPYDLTEITRKLRELL
ncbi:MAG: hypothetical protein DI533_17025 [Cereibacter sphaeroides]|uniref:Response regulatory domain-containing protein n=1 Tax=Cereibacter sphaeroides TaxID=1063 RepID=A0A2W5UDR0_CERSP|nr:MAG: hypothetical protein DI533_17025 [Cereibacter sphaeroides]